MALLFFVSTTGICVDFHYCKGELKRFQLFGKAKSCHKVNVTSGDSEKSLETFKHKTELESRSCCSNKALFSKFSPTNLNIENVGHEPFETFGQIAVLASNQTNFIRSYNHTNDYPSKCYKPPLIFEDKQVDLQQFLF